MMSDTLTELAKRLEPLLVHQAASAAQRVLAAGEGPGVDIVGSKVGIGGDSILVYHADGSPASEYPATDAGLDSATAAVTSGDIVVTPSCTFVADHTLGACVYVLIASTFTGQVTLVDGTLADWIHVTRTANDANDLIGVSAPASGAVTLYQPNITVTQSGAGLAVGLLVTGGTGTPRIEGGQIHGTSVGGYGYGIKNESISCIGSVTYLTFDGTGSGLGGFTWNATARTLQWDGTNGRAYFKACMGAGHNVSGTLSMKFTLQYADPEGAVTGIGSAGGQYLPSYYNAAYTPDTQLSYEPQPAVGGSVTLTGAGTPDAAGNLYFELIAGASAGTVIYVLSDVYWTEGTTAYPVSDVAASSETTTALDCQVSGTTYDLNAGSGSIRVNGCQYDPTKTSGTITSLAGDRAALDAAAYPTLHTNDADTAAGIHHTLGTGANQAAAGDHTHSQLHNPVTVVDTATVDLTLTGQEIKADVIPGAIPIESLENVIESGEAFGDLLQFTDWMEKPNGVESLYDSSLLTVAGSTDPTNAFNKNMTDVWLSNVGAGLHWITFAFGRKRFVSKIIIYTTTGDWIWTGYPWHWHVYGSPTGAFSGEETLIVEGDASQSGIITTTFPTPRVAYRYYKITWPTSGGDLRLNEIEIYTTPDDPKWENKQPSAIKLDDLGTPDDNTDLNASTTAHGLLKKLSGVATEVLNGAGAWISQYFGFTKLTDVPSSYTGNGGKVVAVKSTEDGLEFVTGGSGGSITVEEADGTPSVASVTKIKVPNGSLTDDGSGVVTFTPPSGAGTGDVVGPSGATDGHLAVFDGVTGKLIKDGGAAPSGGAPTDAKYVTTAANSTLSAEVAIPGLAGSADISGSGGGGGISNEFDSGASPFTWSTTLTAESVNTIKSHWYGKLDTSGVRTKGKIAWTPTGAFDLRAKLSIGSNAAAVSSGNYNSIIALTVFATNDEFAIGISTEYGNNRLSVYAYTIIGGSWVQRGPLMPVGTNYIYLRITRDASNNWAWYWSSDGIVWVLVATLSQSATITHSGLTIETNANAKCECTCDWLRANV
jgi:hypothetical protein